MGKLTRSKTRRLAPKPGGVGAKVAGTGERPFGQSGWARSQTPNTSLQALVLPSAVPISFSHLKSACAHQEASPGPS